MDMQSTRILPGGWARILVAAAFALMPAVAAAQAVTSSDIQRLQDEVFQASSDLSRARSSNPELASRLQSTLDDLREEVIYLKVKLRKEGGVSQSEYNDLRDRLQELRAEARGENVERQGAWTGGTGATGTGTTRTADRPAETRTQSSSSAIPVGQELDVRLQTQLSSATAQVEDRFEATTVADLYRGNEVLIPAGSVLRGVVRSVQPATRTNRRAEITVSFDQITVRGRAYPMRGTVTEAIKGEGIKGEVGRIGTGAGVGAIIGGVIGGVRGALLGILIGGGGTIAATEGKEVTLDPGTILRVRLDTPPDIR
jgi:hypothetical protein